jgi:hypothetical protein
VFLLKSLAMTKQLASFDDVLETLLGIEDRLEARPRGAWTLPQVLEHCAQSIEYSIDRYPVLKSGLFRATVGRIAKRKFLGAGAMSHNLEAAIPGAPELAADADATAVLARLRRAIEAFRAHQGPFADHLAYGPCSKEEYERLHAMHVADHLSALE